jgi:hypothetical protein
MVVLYAARHRLAVPGLARWLLARGIVATLAANVARGWSDGRVGAVVAAWPAASLVGSYELLLWLIRTSAACARTGDVVPGRAGAPADHPVTGHRHSLVGSSCSRPGTGPSSRSAYRPPHGAGPGRGFHVPHLGDTAGAGASSIPGTAVPALARCRARPAPAASQRPVPAPRACIPSRGHASRDINGSSRDSPVRPARSLWPPDETRALGRSPVLRTPLLPAAHDRAGPGIEHAPGTTRPA